MCIRDRYVSMQFVRHRVYGYGEKIISVIWPTLYNGGSDTVVYLCRGYNLLRTVLRQVRFGSPSPLNVNVSEGRDINDERTEAVRPPRCL